MGTARVVRSLPGKSLPIQGLLSADDQQAFEALPLETTAEISRFAVSKDFRRRHGELTGNVNLLTGDKRDERSLRPHINARAPVPHNLSLVACWHGSAPPADGFPTFHS